MHPPALPPQAEADWAGGGVGGPGPCGAKGCGESEGEGGGLCPARCQPKTERTAGRRKGGGSWAMDPVASRDGHRAGRGVEREGLETGEDDAGEFHLKEQAKSQGAGGILAPSRLTCSPSPISIMKKELLVLWGHWAACRLAPSTLYPFTLPKGVPTQVTHRAEAPSLPMWNPLPLDGCNDDPTH